MIRYGFTGYFSFDSGSLPQLGLTLRSRLMDAESVELIMAAFAGAAAAGIGSGVQSAATDATNTAHASLKHRLSQLFGREAVEAAVNDADAERELEAQLSEVNDETGAELRALAQRITEGFAESGRVVYNFRDVHGLQKNDNSVNSSQTNYYYY